MKLSIYKCSTCEERAKHGLCVPYLFHKIKRGKKCPNCGCATIRKISISAVMELRWNKTVKPRLASLKS